MKSQTKLAILIISFSVGLAILLNSCKTSSRLTTSYQTSVSRQVEATAASTAQGNTVEATQVNNNISAETEETTTWFDTSKPIDSMTQKPTVVKQQVKKTKIINNSKTEATKKTDQQSSTELGLKANTKVSSKDKEEASRDSKASLSLPWWIYLTAAITIFLLFYFSCPPFKFLVGKWIETIKSRLKIGNR